MNAIGYEANNVVYSRNHKTLGLIEVVSIGLSRIFVNGKSINKAFYDEDKAIAYASISSLVAKALKACEVAA